MLKKLITKTGMLSLVLVWAFLPLFMLERPAEAVTLEVLVPMGVADIKPADLAKRVDGLAGKRIALHWNLKPGGEYLLAEVEAQLKAQYKDADVFYWPAGGVWWTKAEIQEFMKNQPADVVVLSVGD